MTTDPDVFERVILRHAAITEPSLRSLRPKFHRWASRYHAVLDQFGATAAANILTLFVMQAMPHRNRAAEHSLRNLMPWLRPYHL